MEKPAVLYKYYPPERLDFFDNWQVKFSHPAEMNDAFDSHYLVPNGELAKKARIEGTRWRNKVGIFSLAENADNHLMWVHYARNHTGFVIGFDAHAQFFQENDRTLQNVVYRKGPGVMEHADMNVCFTKSDIWEYEKEWRCVEEFESNASRMVDVEPTIIKEIVFGYQLQSWQISRIISWVQMIEVVPIVLKKALPSRSDWSMEIQPCIWKMCPHCQGSGYL